MKNFRNKEKPGEPSHYQVDPLADNRLQVSKTSPNRNSFWQANELPTLPNLRLYADGISISGFKLKLDVQSFLNSKFGFLLGLCSLPKAAATNENSYLFRDLDQTIYKLWLSGIEDLTKVFDELKVGRCNTNTTEIVPENYVLIQNYFEHSGTAAPMYAATLSRDLNGVTNQAVVSCVTDLLNEAHKEWEKDSVSWQRILAIVGIVVGITVITTGIAVYCHRRIVKRLNTVEQQPPDEESCLNRYLGNCGLR